MEKARPLSFVQPVGAGERRLPANPSHRTIAATCARVVCAVNV
jgi:hypothetical protein